jgi:Ca2+-binding EF-hand superfamily protein
MLKNGVRKVKLQMIFNAYDLNNDGALDMQEFGRMLRLNGRLENVVSGDDILDVLTKIDKDHDRKVEFNEWLSYVSPLLVSMSDHDFNRWCAAFMKAHKDSKTAIKDAKAIVTPLVEASHDKKDEKKETTTKATEKK